MGKYVVRRIQESDFADLPSLCSIEEEWYIQVLRLSVDIKKKECYRHNCFVACLNDTLTGFVYGFVIEETLYPQFLFVHRDHRKQGVGTLLLQALEAHSNCTVSMVYFHKDLEEYYAKQEYNIGTNLKVGMKTLQNSHKE